MPTNHETTHCEICHLPLPADLGEVLWHRALAHNRQATYPRRSSQLAKLERSTR